MIYRDEINSKSAEYGIHTTNVQRDYVFGWLLCAIYNNDYLSKNLILKGGNCFRKVYFPDTRFSNDLDFSTERSINIDELQKEFNACCQFAQDMSGISFVTDKNRVEKDRNVDSEKAVYKARIYFKDFYGKESSIVIAVRLDITEFDKIYLPAETRPLIHPYSDADNCQAQVQCLALEELIANKMKCLIQRRHTADLYDLVYSAFFDHQFEINRSQVISTFLRKTIFRSSPSAARQILLGLPITFFKAAWQKYIVCPIKSRIDFDAGFEKYRSLIDELFLQAGGSSSASLAFFPPELRNPILEAASEKKLLRLIYDGHERLVEPYSLAYKRRKDGVAQEYFYAYDQTGGKNGPGIKAFLNPKIQKIEVTEHTFEPQFEIELSKSGESQGDGYFSGVFGGSKSMFRRRPSAFRPSRTYKIVCSVCGKAFERKTSNRQLNKHKSPSGYDCYGRYGHLQ